MRTLTVFETSDHQAQLSVTYQERSGTESWVFAIADRGGTSISVELSEPQLKRLVEILGTEE